MYFLGAEASLRMAAEQIDGKNLLIRKFRMGVIAESLAAEPNYKLLKHKSEAISNS